MPSRPSSARCSAWPTQAIWAVICIVPIGVILGLPAYFVIRSIRRRRKAAKATAAEA